MKRFMATLMAVLCLVGFFCNSIAEGTDLMSRLQDAREISWAPRDYDFIELDNQMYLSWASRDYVILDNQMIRVRDGKVLFDIVYNGNNGDFYYNIVSTGGYVWFHTPNGIHIMDQAGSIESMEANPDGWLLHSVSGKFGLFYGKADKILIDDGNQTITDGWTERWEDEGKTIYLYSDSSKGFVYDPEAKQLTILSGISCVSDAYRDPEGQVYFISIDWTQWRSGYTFGICKADGEQVVKEGKYGYAKITNDYLAIYTDNGIGAISPYTGEVIWTLDDCYWPTIDGVALIYSDNISIVERKVETENGRAYDRMLVGLDGTILSTFFCNDYPYMESVYGWPSNNYNVLTDRNYIEEERDGVQYITCIETGEIYKETEDGNEEEKKYKSLESGKILSEDEILHSGEIIPERYEKYKPASARKTYIRYAGEGIEIVSPDGKVLGGQPWERIADGWDEWRDDIFKDTSLCAVIDENDLCAVINKEGDIVLPAEYERIEQVSSFSDDPEANGHCLVAEKDGKLYFFTEKGEPLFTESDAEPTGEPAAVSDT